MYITKRIVLITREVKFAIDAKNALERDGEFAVTTFSSARAAVDFVRQNAQDLALIDFRVRDMTGTDVIDHMRALQPDLAVIAAPDHPTVRDLQAKYNIQALINLPYPTRKLSNVLYTAIQQMYEAQPETRSSVPVDDDSAAMRPRYSRTIEFWVSDASDGGSQLEFVSAPDLMPPDEPTSIFAKLAAEEPPMPTFAEGSTIRDLHDRLVNPENLRRIIHSLTTEENQQEKQDVPETLPENAHAIPAAMILEAALDESTPIRVFSLSEFMNRVQERGQGMIEPLPSWLEEGERYIREPGFLPEILPEAGTEYTATPTVLSSGVMIEPSPGDLVTDPLEFAPVIQYPEPEAEVSVEEPQLASDVAEEQAIVSVEPDALPLDAQEVQEHAAVLNVPISAPEVAPAVVVEQPPTRFSYTEVDEESPQVAQLAVTLTQVSLELTAEATLLTRYGKIVAYAGNLPAEDIQELREEVGDDWEGESSRSRIRFVTLSSSGADYMLFTRKTTADYTLSMVFAGNRPLHEIRRQGQRLADALAVVPEVPVDVPQEPLEDPAVIVEEPVQQFPSEEEIGERSPFTYVWVLKDQGETISDSSARAMIRDLDLQLTRAGWQIHDLNVHEDFVYLFADMPVKFDVRTAVRDLMTTSASTYTMQQSESQPAQIWDDGYLVLQPGRSMELDEIQRFINFLRR